MQETFEINAVSRSAQGKGASRRLRREGLVPGIVYGGDKTPELVATKHNELIRHLQHEAVYSHILTVNVDGAKQKVVLKDLQRHPAKPFVIHFDLLRVADTDRIKMHVPLHFLGEDVAPGVKQGGRAFHHFTDVEVVCQAQDLPEYIEVDLSGMGIGDIVHLSDLQMPEGVEVLALTQGADHDDAVVVIQAGRGGAAAEDAGTEGGEGA